MASKKATVLLTENFERNLDEIERFHQRNGEPRAFQLLLNQLTDEVLPNLESFTEIGRPFADRRTMTKKGEAAFTRLSRKLESVHRDAAIREYVLADYLILYAALPGKLYLLAIRHHRQLAYDLHSLTRREAI